MFLTDLALIAEPRPDFWRLEAPLIWTDPVHGRLMAPAGFVTDLASIPMALRNLPFLDVDGLSRRPAAMHDWLYSSRAGYRLGRDFADDFLRAALLAEGASAWTAGAFYWAVRIGGRAHWEPVYRRTL